MFHIKTEGGKSPGVGGKEIEEVPLRHEGDKFAARGQSREVGQGSAVAVKAAGHFANLLVRQFQEFLEEAKLMHKLQGGGMDGITAEIAIEIGVLFKHGNLHAGASEQIAGHHSSGP